LRNPNWQPQCIPAGSQAWRRDNWDRQRSASLCDSAEPGQVLVSHSTQALLEGEILEELELGDLGERELPGITATRVFELVDRSAPS
jgi:class 3 adenylate cyclase